MSFDDIPFNEIRVSKNPGLGRYLRRAHEVLISGETPHESVVLRAAGAAISNLVPLAELIRRRIAGLHQNTEITTMELMEFREPYEGGEKREFKRTMTMLKVTLSKTADDEMKQSAGY